MGKSISKLGSRVGKVCVVPTGQAVFWFRKASRRCLRSACSSLLLVGKWIVFHPYMLNPPRFKSLRSGLWEVRRFISHISWAVNLCSHISGTCVWLGAKVWSPEFSFWSFSEHCTYVKLWEDGRWRSFPSCAAQTLQNDTEMPPEVMASYLLHMQIR